MVRVIMQNCYTNFNSYCFVLFCTQHFVQIMKLLNPLNWTIVDGYQDQQIAGILSLNQNLSKFCFLASVTYSCPGICDPFQYHIVQEGVCLPHTHGERRTPASKPFSLSPATCRKALLKAQWCYALRVAGMGTAHSSANRHRKTFYNHIFSSLCLLSLFCFASLVQTFCYFQGRKSLHVFSTSEHSTCTTCLFPK